MRNLIGNLLFMFLFGVFMALASGAANAACRCDCRTPVRSAVAAVNEVKPVRTAAKKTFSVLIGGPRQSAGCSGVSAPSCSGR